MSDTYAIISIACHICGNDMAVSLLDHKPTEEETKANRKKIGGTWCINTRVVKVNVGETVVTTLT